jgi:hypothetical protein
MAGKPNITSSPFKSIGFSSFLRSLSYRGAETLAQCGSADADVYQHDGER